jgi:coenzyme PQQ precursor peptide PqqA
MRFQGRPRSTGQGRALIKNLRLNGKRRFDGCLGAVVTYIRLWAPSGLSLRDEEGNDAMAWSTPVVFEVCVGMEVTSYLSAEM